jgi:hypothetical protein
MRYRIYIIFHILLFIPLIIIYCTAWILFPIHFLLWLFFNLNLLNWLYITLTDKLIESLEFWIEYNEKHSEG